MLRAWRNTAAPATAGGMALAACGGDDDASPGARSEPGNPIDRAFVTDVVPLEEKTVSLAQIALRRAASDLVRALAGDVVRDQTRQIGTMRRIGAGLSAANVKIGSLGVDRRAEAVNASTAPLQTAKRSNPPSCGRSSRCTPVPSRWPTSSSPTVSRPTSRPSRSRSSRRAAPRSSRCASGWAGSRRVAPRASRP